jgi:drug/metabolite transporter (DMT)-like permease
MGNVLFIVNAFSYGLYLILVKPLTAKYHSFTLMKWLFLVGVVINLPITLPEFLEVSWSELPFDAIWRIAYVVIGTTFCTYLFNIYALTQLKASTVSAFVYVQPIIGILFAIISGKDHLTTVKIIAALFVMLGVYLVSLKPKKQRSA